MIVPMHKLELVVFESYFQNVLKELQELRYLHLETVPLSESGQEKNFARMHLTNEKEQQRALLEEICSIGEEIGKRLGNTPADPAFEAGIDEIKSLAPEKQLEFVMGLRRKVKAVQRRRFNIGEDQSAIKKYHTIAAFVESLDLNLDEHDVHIFFYRSTETGVRKTIQSKLRILDCHSIRYRFFGVGKEKKIGVVVCAKEYIDKVKEITWNAGAVEFFLPISYRGRRITENYHQIDTDLTDIPMKLAKIDSQIEELRGETYKVEAIRQACHQDMQRLAAVRHCITGRYTKVLQIWTPIDKIDEVTKVVNNASDGSYAVEVLKKGYRFEDVPVALKNVSYARPFEVLLKLFPPPTHHTLDPTLLNSITVPLFFGLIVGDIVYGTAMLVFILLLRGKFRNVEIIRSATMVGIYCALSTIAFGCLFSEFLGSIGHHYLGLWPPIFNREDPDSTIILLILAVGIGLIHVTIGIIVGIINARSLADRHAFLERTGQLLCLLSSCVFIAAAVWFGTAAWIFGTVVLVSGVLLLVIGQGPLGLLELTSIVTNILSYSRLMALGVASVVIARVANEMFFTLNNGVFGLIAGIFVAMSLHGMNIILSMFSPTIHTLRLHYVEFFTKFYKTNGRTYVPFGKRA